MTRVQIKFSCSFIITAYVAGPRVVMVSSRRQLGWHWISPNKPLCLELQLAAGTVRKSEPVWYLPSDSSQECDIWYHPKGPVCSGAINAPSKWGGSGLCRQAHSVGLHSSSTAVSCCVRFCISWGQCHWQAWALLSPSSGKQHLGPAWIPNSQFLHLHKAARGKRGDVSEQDSTPCSQLYRWGSTVRYIIALSAGGQTWNLN